MKKEKEELEEPSSPFWMTTYSDMVTLLLVFFILILSYSTVELEKFRGAMSSMKGALGIMPEMGSSVPNRKPNFHERMTTRNTNITERLQSFNDAMKKAASRGLIETEVTAAGVHIRLGDKVLYDIGRATIKSSAYPILREIAVMVRGETKEIYVEGHTDDVPISTAKFPSNWELSTARAMSVVKYLHNVEGISAKKLAAVGHGEFRPLMPNTSRENRARNRRVEIFIKWE